jgi:hypothetical protein
MHDFYIVNDSHASNKTWQHHERRSIDGPVSPRITFRGCPFNRLKLTSQLTGCWKVTTKTNTPQPVAAIPTSD